MNCIAYPHQIITGNVNCNNVTNTGSHGNIVGVNEVVADDNPEILRRLSPLDPRRKNQGVRTDKLGGVGNWLLEINGFQG